MTKMKDRRSQQDMKQERKLPPQAPVPYEMHREAMHESEEDGEDVSKLPPPYVPDEEQCITTPEVELGLPTWGEVYMTMLWWTGSRNDSRSERTKCELFRYS